LAFLAVSRIYWHLVSEEKKKSSEMSDGPPASFTYSLIRAVALPRD
jgi:hypothetical protein